MLAVCDRRGDERVRVRDARGLGEVYHLVGVVLLVARKARGKQRVDSIYSGELHAWLVREDITPADELLRQYSG